MCTTTWLTRLRKAEAASGVDHTELVCHPEDLTGYAQRHLDEAIRLLTRAEVEMPASGMTDAEQRALWVAARRTIVSQVVDAIDAAGKALAALGCTDAELDALRDHGKETVKSNTARNHGKNSDVVSANQSANTKK